MVYTDWICEYIHRSSAWRTELCMCYVLLSHVLDFPFSILFVARVVPPFRSSHVFRIWLWRSDLVDQSVNITSSLQYIKRHSFEKQSAEIGRMFQRFFYVPEQVVPGSQHFFKVILSWWEGGRCSKHRKHAFFLRKILRVHETYNVVWGVIGKIISWAFRVESVCLGVEFIHTDRSNSVLNYQFEGIFLQTLERNC